MYFFVEQFTCGICDASLSDSRTVFFSALPEGGGVVSCCTDRGCEGTGTPLAIHLATNEVNGHLGHFFDAPNETKIAR